MKNIVIDGHDYERLADGRLKNMSDWTPEAACALAEEDNIVLKEDHWPIINLMRDFYNKYNISPIRKLLKKEIARKIGQENATDSHIDSLFPSGIHQATKYAGLPISLIDSEIEASSKIKPVDASKPSLDITGEFAFKGKHIKVYPIGNLVNLDDWSEELAEYMAKCEDITLTERHWDIIRYLRQFYFRYSITPMVKLLCRHVREETGDSSITESSLYSLFPKGPSRQGSRIAGLPEPQGCLD